MYDLFYHRKTFVGTRNVASTQIASSLLDVSTTNGSLDGGIAYALGPLSRNRRLWVAMRTKSVMSS
jgi:hypothetical protein